MAYESSQQVYIPTVVSHEYLLQQSIVFRSMWRPATSFSHNTFAYLHCVTTDYVAALAKLQQFYFAFGYVFMSVTNPNSGDRLS
jgi:hypothetical protein